MARPLTPAQLAEQLENVYRDPRGYIFVRAHIGLSGLRVGEHAWIDPKAAYMRGLLRKQAIWPVSKEAREALIGPDPEPLRAVPDVLLDEPRGHDDENERDRGEDPDHAVATPSSDAGTAEVPGPGKLEPDAPI